MSILKSFIKKAKRSKTIKPINKSKKISSTQINPLSKSPCKLKIRKSHPSQTLEGAKSEQNHLVKRLKKINSHLFKVHLV